MVWAVDLWKEKNTNIHTYIHTYIHKLKMHIGYVSPTRGGGISEAIAKKFGILTDLGYVINFVKFGYDGFQGWSLVGSQILWFCLHLRSHP